MIIMHYYYYFIIIILIIIIIIFDGDTFYWVNLSSLHPFEVYTKCDDFSGVSGASNQSYEHKIRAYLLDNYDKTVRPVLGNKSVEVSFSMKISRLVKVVSKK